jgi:hypothetical protein
MTTATISPPNRTLSVTLGLSLLALAVPGCLADAGDGSDPGARAATAPPTAPRDGVKPLPVRPELSSPILEGVPPPKSAHASEPVTGVSNFAWTASLTVNSSSLWPTQYATLTATTNSDLLRTPYYLVIYNTNTGQWLNSCGGGTTCSVAVTEPTETVDGFVAYVQDFVNPPIAASGPQFVTWHGAGLRLSASQNTTTVGASVTLTTTTDQDIGPSPFYVEIYDATTGTWLNDCGFGTTCSATVSQAAATTHAYRAYLSLFGTSSPPPSVEETTPATYVTWADKGYTLGMSAPVINGLRETVTVTANVDVGPTPYYIEVFNDYGTLLGYCGSGSVCQVTYDGQPFFMNVFAFISPFDSHLLPANILASSNTVAAPLIIQ